MNTNEILSNKAAAIVEEGVAISIALKPSNKFHALLQRYKILPREKVFCIEPLTLGTLLKISNILLTIPEDMYDPNLLLQNAYKSMASHSATIAHIIAIALKNKKGPVSAKSIDFLLHRITPADLKRMLSIILKQMDVANFMHTIISIRGLNVLATKEMSPEDQGS